MGRNATWTNEDGLVVGFGTRTVESERAAVLSVSGQRGEYVLDFTYDDLPDTADKSADFSYIPLPSGAIIEDATIVATTTFAGGTSYDVGLYENGSTDAIDADGIFDAVLLAEINAGDLASSHGGTNSGAVNGTTLTTDAKVVVAATGTFTAGAAKLIITYRIPA